MVARTIVDPATDYARDVCAKRIVAGELVRLACKRHLDDLKHGHKRGLKWDPARAEAAIEFFRLLRHSKGRQFAGKPFELEAWQKFFVGCIYGWRKADGSRRFTVAHLEVARKNGKTTLASGIGLAELVLSGEPGAEVYTCATKREQAKITHGESLRMVKKSLHLRKRVKVFKDAITVPAMDAKYVPLAADANTHDGLNPSCAVMDELHAWRDRLLWDVIETGIDARAEPLLLITTTAGYDRHSIWWERRELAIEVLKGAVDDDELFAYIATLDPDDDWKDPKVWAKANPNLGISLDREKFAKRVKQVGATPGKLSAFKRLRLNIPTDSASIWIDPDRWDACKGLVDPDRLVGRPCWCGFDLSTARDLTAAVFVFPPEDEDDENDPWIVLPRFWLPEEDIDARSEEDGVPYDQWAEAGHITLIPGRVIRYSIVRDHLIEDANQVRLMSFVFDQWNAIQTATDLKDEGFEVVPFRQGFRSYKTPVMEFEKLVESRRILHDGNPVLRSCVVKCAVEQDPAGNRKPTKKHSKGRIDGVVAMVMGIGEALVQGCSGSSYEEEGLEL